MENESLIPKSSLQSTFYAMAIITLSILGLIYFEGILKPLVVACLIWFIINRLKITIGKIKIRGRSLPHLVSNVLALSILVLINYLVVELLISNLEGISASMPEYVANLNETYNEANALINDPEYSNYIQKWINSLNVSGMATSLLNSLSVVVANAVVIFVYVIFLLLEEAARKEKVSNLYPEKGRKYEKFNNNLEHINGAIRSYLWSKTLISLVTGIISCSPRDTLC